MCKIDVFLVPLILSWIGGIIATLAYLDTHKGLLPLTVVWILVLLATMFFIQARKMEKVENQKSTYTFRL